MNLNNGHESTNRSAGVEGSTVTQAKAGAQFIRRNKINIFWIPAFAGMTVYSIFNNLQVRTRSA
jgi:hypothetical protein